MDFRRIIGLTSVLALIVGASSAAMPATASIAAHPEAVARSRGVPSVSETGWWCNDAVVRPGAAPQITNPIVGDYNGDGRDDILWLALWYLGASHIWYGTASGAPFTSTTLPLSNQYTPLPGRFDTDGFGDLVLFDNFQMDGAQALLGDNSGLRNGPYLTLPDAVSGFNLCTFVQYLVVADFNGDHLDDVMLYRSGGYSDDIFWAIVGAGANHLWYGKNAGFTDAGPVP